MENSADLQPGLAFLDGQMLLAPSLNEQLGHDFQGLRRSFKEDSTHPDSHSVASFGRIWIYDVALSIYADLKAGRIRQAGYQAGRVMQLALREEAAGYRGLWHFSYNTTGDSFIDPRGPAGANAWCLNAIYAYLLVRADASLLTWANRMVQQYLFDLQVVDPNDPRDGLILAGFHNAEDLSSPDMGYGVYKGNPNVLYPHVILEHCVDTAATFRLAWRVNSKQRPNDIAFLEELAARHDRLMRGIRRRFWQGNHFVSAIDSRGVFYTGTDGEPSIAIDNNTWAAHLFLPYEPELAQQAAAYAQERFLIQTPAAQVENSNAETVPHGLEGVYYFPASFEDPFVKIPDEHRHKMEKLLHPEAAFGLVLLLWDAAGYLPSEKERSAWQAKARQLYEKTTTLQRLYGPQGAPYASVNVPSVFCTLQSVTTAASAVITTSILGGSNGDDFIGVLPPEAFKVDGKSPVKTAS